VATQCGVADQGQINKIEVGKIANSEAKSNKDKQYGLNGISVSSTAKNEQYLVQDNTTKSYPNEDRKIAHAKAKLNLSRIMFPVDLDNIHVISLGEISQISAFHSLVRIYPLNYKCEVYSFHETSNTPKKGNSRESSSNNDNSFRNKDEHCISFEVREKFGGPEFVIQVKALSKVFRASTEEAVRKKVQHHFGWVLSLTRI